MRTAVGRKHTDHVLCMRLKVFLGWERNLDGDYSAYAGRHRSCMYCKIFWSVQIDYQDMVCSILQLHLIRLDVKDTSMTSLDSACFMNSLFQLDSPNAECNR